MANDDLMTWNFYSEGLIGDGQASMVEVVKGLVVGDKIYSMQCESDS